MNIPFKALPGYNELFLDYIEDFQSLRQFYEYDYASQDELRKCAEHVSESYKTGRQFFRDDLTSILLGQNQNFGSGEMAIRNISLLNQHNTLAVVTGQQVGLLTGPMYTVIKALNTVQLSNKLGKLFPEYNFVPVFWLESDDHDFLEINNITVINKEYEVQKFSYFENGTEKEKYLTPAGRIVIDDHITGLVNDLESSLGSTDFSGELFETIRKCYARGKSMSAAFGSFLNFVLGDRGVVLIDPSDARIKELIKPVFRRALAESSEIAENVINTTVELESSHIAQVKPKPVNLFYIHEGSRYLLEPRDGGNFALKNSRQRFTGDELYDLLESSPANFSWNVITRPVCQDFLLPTVAYIGGPSEVSYFAQLKGAYKVFDMKMPVIYPRTSVTLIDGRTKTFMEKNGVDLSGLSDEKELVRLLLRRSLDTNPEDLFGKMKDELVALFYTFEKQLNAIDANQTAAFMKRANQFTESLEVAKEKFTSAQARQNEVLTGQVRKVVTTVYPASLPQERALNISMYLNKYGSDLLDMIERDVSVDVFMHQTVDLTSNSA